MRLTVTPETRLAHSAVCCRSRPAARWPADIVVAILQAPLIARADQARLLRRANPIVATPASISATLVGSGTAVVIVIVTGVVPNE